MTSHQCVQFDYVFHVLAGCRFELAGRIKTNDMKVNCLVQATLGSLTISDFELQQDVAKILRSATRVLRCAHAFRTRYMHV